MKNKSFIFQINSYDTGSLLPQVSKALEKRTELVSRERYPGLWKHIDKLNNDVEQRRTQSKPRTKIMSVVCLALGIFLFVPGLMEPQELLVPLLTGAIAMGAGIGGLWRSQKHTKNPFDKSAKLLLESKDTMLTEQSITVSFSETGMTIPTGNSSTDLVPYSNFECIIETADILLFVYDMRVAVLHKLDLTTGNIDDFCNFISEKVTGYHSII